MEGTLRPAVPAVEARVADAMERYGSFTRPALLRELPHREPRAWLYDLLHEYPLRGGKLLRSALCLASCLAFGGSIEAALDTAVAIELLHNAFLIHDDIEDGSLVRRGQPALHRAHGMPLALNAGDALSLLSFQPLLRNFDQLGPRLAGAILEETHVVARETAEGQAVELGWRRDNAWGMDGRDYLRMVAKKTCWYTAILPLRAGAAIAVGRPLDHRFALTFGLFLGAAFQIRDDVLNISGDGDRTGKEIGDDVFEGKRTLMLLHMHASASPAERARIERIFALPRERRTPAQVRWVIGRMDAYGSLDMARAWSHGLAGAALYEFDSTFGHLPDSDHKRFLFDLVVYMSERGI
jgi:geranylgeranyl diphosphate synthase type II